MDLFRFDRFLSGKRDFEKAAENKGNMWEDRISKQLASRKMGASASSLSPEGRVRIVRDVKYTLDKLNIGEWTDAEKMTIIKAKIQQLLLNGGFREGLHMEVLKSKFSSIMLRNSLAQARPDRPSSAKMPPVSPRTPRKQSFAVGQGPSFSPSMSENKVSTGIDPTPIIETSHFGALARASSEATSPATSPRGNDGRRTIVAEAAVPMDPFSGMDSWDSAKQQFICGYCSMTFVNEKKLTFHLKYSDSHTKSVAKWKQKQGDEAQALVSERHLLYSGAKFFWKLNLSLDLDLYFHSAELVKPNCIEVISCDASSGSELPRMYLDYELASAAVKADVDEEVRARRRNLQTRLLEALAEKDASIDTSSADAGPGALRDAPPPTTADFDEESIRREVERAKIASFVLSRVKVVNKAEEGGGEGEIALCAVFEPFSSDAEGMLLSTVPKRLMPVKLTRHKQSTTEEVAATLRELKTHQAALSQHTDNAERLSNLASAAVGGFAEAVRCRQEAKKHMSAARIRFQAAVRKVIAQIQVARTTKMLVGLGLWVEEEEDGKV